jgi:hypothetical protein
VGPATVYPYWPILTLEVQRLALEHPDRVRLHTAGTSTLGLDLYMLEIADFGAIDEGNGIPLDDREVVWVDGGTHSNEYSAVYFTLAWAQFLLDEYGRNETATWIVDNRHTWIMPMVNPDGSYGFGRLNANLVNINRNYPVVWDGVGHDPLMNNRGPHPGSEVETQINIAWFNQTRADYYASIHCCGNLWLYPFGEEGVDPVDEQMLARVCEEAFPSVRDRCGPIWSTIYPASGSSVDTAYEYAGMVAYGYEMSGRGAVSLWGQPFTFEDVRTQEIESWTGLEHAFLNVHRYGAHLEVVDVEAVRDGVRVTVQNTGYGPASQARVSWTDGAGTTAASLGLIPAGSTGSVLVPARIVDGVATVEVEYPKRLIATSNLGQLAVPVAVGADAEGAQDAAFVLDGTVQRPVPAVGILALVGLLAFAWLRRRD